MDEREFEGGEVVIVTGIIVGGGSMTLEGLIAERKRLQANVEDTSQNLVTAMEALTKKLKIGSGFMLHADWLDLDQAVLNARKDYMEAVEELAIFNGKDFEV